MIQAREQELTTLFAKNEFVRFMLKYAKRITLHQDQVADDLTDGQLTLLGALVKVAGFRGIEITFSGTCGEKGLVETRRSQGSTK